MVLCCLSDCALKQKWCCVVCPIVLQSRNGVVLFVRLCFRVEMVLFCLSDCTLEQKWCCFVCPIVLQSRNGVVLFSGLYFKTSLVFLTLSNPDYDLLCSLFLVFYILYHALFLNNETFSFLKLNLQEFTLLLIFLDYEKLFLYISILQ